MGSPRFVGSASPLPKHTLAYLAALAVVLAPVPCRAQSTDAGPDSVEAVVSDSGGTGVTSGDSVAVASGDTARSAGSDSAARPRPAPAPAPVDSALAVACEAAAGGTTDLLIVTFRPTTTPSERAAVAREVGGRLLGTSEYAAPGSWYLRVPGSDADRALADRLILLSPVLEVGTTQCPPGARR